MAWLINAAQLDKFRKSQKSLIIFDASIHMPATDRDAKKEFEDKHIIGAKFFDIDLFTDPNHSAPHMLIQDEKLINEKLSALGVKNDYKIIFYDNSDLHSACRALWMMKVFGHKSNLLYLLDGGFAAWEKYKGKIETGAPPITPRQYFAQLKPHHIATLTHVKEAVKLPFEQIVDLRHPVRFAGGKEPRPGLRQGHMPGSRSLPFTNLFDKNGLLLPLTKLQKLLESISIDPKLPTIATCGSGVTASIFDFVLDLMGNQKHAVYDGSWSEWGAEILYPGEKSLDERPVKTCIEEDLPAKIE